MRQAPAGRASSLICFMQKSSFRYHLYVLCKNRHLDKMTLS